MILPISSVGVVFHVFAISFKFLPRGASLAAHPLLSSTHRPIPHTAEWIPRPALAIFGKVLKPSPTLSKVIAIQSVS